MPLVQVMVGGGEKMKNTLSYLTLFAALSIPGMVYAKGDQSHRRGIVETAECREGKDCDWKGGRENKVNGGNHYHEGCKEACYDRYGSTRGGHGGETRGIYDSASLKRDASSVEVIYREHGGKWGNGRDDGQKRCGKVCKETCNPNWDDNYQNKNGNSLNSVDDLTSCIMRCNNIYNPRKNDDNEHHGVIGNSHTQW